ncbi:MAG: helix-turn-helix domain-containing protein [Chromatiaceae bacterium]|nr:helix-turn-helix domain-containing protein [Chromatiaceae bacterium]MCP5315227.1 helix-turn-helix domain-containing protein [Chromatiaceae bacterium]MCP5428654.1 helix-turn-helix domain-containing protein [Chromatiaceae bacterium]
MPKAARKPLITDPEALPRLVTETQASEVYGFSVAWFRYRRWAGGGPPYVKIGRSVRYPKDELHRYFTQRPLLHSTGEPQESAD